MEIDKNLEDKIRHLEKLRREHKRGLEELEDQLEDTAFDIVDSGASIARVSIHSNLPIRAIETSPGIFTIDWFGKTFKYVKLEGNDQYACFCLVRKK